MEEGSRVGGPAMRLLVLWLAGAPLAMLGLAVFFALLAAGDDNWGLLAVMVLLAVLAVALFLAQGLVLRRYTHRQEGD